MRVCFRQIGLTIAALSVALPSYAVSFSQQHIADHWLQAPGAITHVFSPGAEPPSYLRQDPRGLRPPSFLTLLGDFTTAGDFTFSGTFYLPTGDQDAVHILYGWQDIENHHRLTATGNNLQYSDPADILGTNGVPNCFLSPPDDPPCDNGPDRVYGIRVLEEISGVPTYQFQQPTVRGHQENGIYDFSISRTGDDFHVTLVEDYLGTLTTLVDLSYSDPDFLDGRIGIGTEKQPHAFFSNLSFTGAQVMDVPVAGAGLLALCGAVALRRRLR